MQEVLRMLANRSSPGFCEDDIVLGKESDLPVSYLDHVAGSQARNTFFGFSLSN